MPWNSQSLDPSAGKLRTPENGTTPALPAPDPTRKKPVSGAVMPLQGSNPVSELQRYARADHKRLVG